MAAVRGPTEIPVERPPQERLPGQVGQLWRFVRDISIGDLVLTPVKASREVLMGTIAGDYEYLPDLISDKYPNVRRVNWLKKVPRRDMTPRLRNTIGSSLTLFRVDGFDEEIGALLAGAAPPEEESVETPTVSLWEDTKAKADELIADLVAATAAYDFQALVAALLRAMGFRTVESPPGPDGGRDVLAHRDAFGLEPPRIRVEVKHRKSPIGAPDVRAFRVAIRPDETGLFVSTGGFTNEALREPEKAGRPLTLIDQDRFIELLCEHYDRLEPEFRAMVPLKALFIPVPRE